MSGTEPPRSEIRGFRFSARSYALARLPARSKETRGRDAVRRIGGRALRDHATGT